MKRLIHIVFALVSIAGFCQQPEGDFRSPALDFVDANIGKKVGKGVCFDLIRKAFEQENRDWLKEWDNNKSKHRVSREEVQPGDIIVFHGCKWVDGHKSSNHIGIVYSIDSLLLEIADQNVGSGPKKMVRSYGKKVAVHKNSSVKLRNIDLSLLVKGRIEFYRF